VQFDRVSMPHAEILGLDFHLEFFSATK